MPKLQRLFAMTAFVAIKLPSKWLTVLEADIISSCCSKTTFSNIRCTVALSLQKTLHSIIIAGFNDVLAPTSPNMIYYIVVKRLFHGLPCCSAVRKHPTSFCRECSCDHDTHCLVAKVGEFQVSQAAGFAQTHSGSTKSCRDQ